MRTHENIALSRDGIRIEMYYNVEEQKVCMQLMYLDFVPYIWKSIDSITTNIDTNISCKDAFILLEEFFSKMESKLSPSERGVYAEKLYLDQSKAEKEQQEVIAKMQKLFNKIKI